ncbi:MAG: hypothetical protein RPU34_13545 [Candidatus Sedimenticola sp. (ex Thyasira tokunagai)]
MESYDYATNPPFMAGESLPVNSQTVVIYPRFEKDKKTIAAWYCCLVPASSADTDIGKDSLTSPTEALLADGSEIWCSAFTSLRNPSDGREYIYAIAKKVYT